ncbi:hypothetical protein [Nonomuraea typhae]|uniref:Uncharacterized protein n=1 Tax=Nonomuraea typhae TaxID=2603600 RepID=A0ABW7YRV8_9ACTN
MAFLSRLFRRETGPDREREQAHAQGMRDARQHALHQFTDPDCQPAYLGELRAMARERIARLDRELAGVRTALLRQAGTARQAVLEVTLQEELTQNGSANGQAAPAGEDGFISIAEARRRRAERRRAEAVRAAVQQVHEARAQVERLAREWDGAVLRRNHDVEEVHAWAQRMIAAYRSGVMRAHPRREEIPPLWKGEVIAMDTAAVTSGEEMGRLLDEVEHRVERWQATVNGHHELKGATASRELPAPHDTDETPGDENMSAPSEGTPPEETTPEETTPEEAT